MTIAPRPSVSTEIGTTTTASAGQTNAFEQADDEAGREGVAGAIDGEAVEQPRQQAERERGGDDDEQGAAEQPRPRRPLAGRADDRLEGRRIGGHVGPALGAVTGTSNRSDGSRRRRRSPCPAASIAPAKRSAGRCSQSGGRRRPVIGL